MNQEKMNELVEWLQSADVMHTFLKNTSLLASNPPMSEGAWRLHNAMLKKLRTALYNHAEAFCLMNYTCSECGKDEVIWNSRDGVTPFVVSCSAEGCEGTMFHRDWHLDKCSPLHTPGYGDRIFVDLTREAATEFRQRYINQWWDADMEARYGTREQALEELVTADLERSGAPNMITVKEKRS